MTASAEATLIAGVLAARSRLEEPLDEAAVLAAANDLIGPATVWVPMFLDTPADVDEYRRAAHDFPAEWQPPDEATVSAHDAALAGGWRRVEELMDRPRFEATVIRLAVRSWEHAIAVRQLGRVGDLVVSPFIAAPIGQWRWRWPVRVGVVAGPEADARSRELSGFGEFADQYQIRIVAPDEPAELDVLVIDELDDDPAARGGVVIVIGEPVPDDDAATLDRRAHRGARLQPGAVVALPDRDLLWFQFAIRELSHDRPLDAAVGIARPGAFIVGDPHLFGVTAIRDWLFSTADALERRHGPLPINDELRGIATHDVFDSETRGGRHTAATVTQYTQGGGPLLEVLGSAARAVLAEPPRPDPAEPAKDAPEDRRILTRITDPDGNVRTDGFVDGGVSKVAVRIGPPEEGAVYADVQFESPTPGEAVDLDVIVQIGGSKAKPQKRSLRLPAHGPSEWTEPVALRVPKGRAELTIYVTVLWKGRAIQSATLSGPVLPRGSPVGPLAMTATIDVAPLPAAGDSSPAADATFIVRPGPGDTPVLFDASRDAPIAAGKVAEANASLRRDLIDILRHPPAGLAAAARDLARLAGRGADLRRKLCVKDEHFYDDATWIHITSFEEKQIPFELIYTHPTPDRETPKVCAPALAGAKSCAQGCPDREDATKVCPFGFWATTKVIERRTHTNERVDVVPSDQRVVPVRSGTVCAVTPKANANDPDASKRIATAFEQFSDKGTAAVAGSWTELEAAVKDLRNLVCLVTHTIEPPDPLDDRDTKLELGSEAKFLDSIDGRYVNPEPRRTPGPVVLALGCDTADIHTSYADFVSQLHYFGAEIVVSAISQIPGVAVANFVQRLLEAITVELEQPGEKRFGTVLTATPREVLLAGDVLALALTASGDGDVQIGVP